MLDGQIFIVFPAIDLLGGQVVRLRQGNITRQTVYSDDPASTARTWLEAGVSWLHVVNLDGAFGETDSANQAALVSILEEASHFGAGVQMGGGLRSSDTIQRAIDIGIHRVILGTLAVEHPDILARMVDVYGAERIAAGIDVKQNKVQVRGWTEGTSVQAVDLGKQLAGSGVKWIVYTDVSRDGIGSGINLNACVELARATHANVVAAGGVSGPEDIHAAQGSSLAGVIVGRALYEGQITSEGLRLSCAMFAKRIIPCLDIQDGRVVKGVNFANLRDAGDPVEQARLYNAAGADELVFLDISATHRGRETVVDVVQRVAEQVFMPLTVGGGIRSVDDMRQILLAGADKVSVNSAAVRNPQILSDGADRFGSQCIVLAIDAKCITGAGEPARWEVFIGGGRIPTGIDALSWSVHAVSMGAGEILLTSMDRDGTLAGYDIELTLSVAEAVPVPVIASGGAGGVRHFFDVLSRGKADAALAASLFHDGVLSIPALKSFLDSQGVPVRP